MVKTKKTFTKRVISLMLTLMMTLVFLPQVPQLKANAVTKYNLWLYDKQVTSANCNDILGNRSARYDLSTKTLYISKNVVNYKNNNYDLFNYTFPFVKSYINGLTIDVADDVEASGHAEPFEQIKGFMLYADTTITGNGRLFSDGHYPINVFGNSTLTIKDVEVSINHLHCYFTKAMGIYGNGDNTKLRIEHSSIFVKSNPDENTAAISGFKRGIELVNVVFRDNDAKIAYVSGKTGICDGYAVVSAKDGSFKKSVYTEQQETSSSDGDQFVPINSSLYASKLRADISSSLDEIKGSGSALIEKIKKRNFVNKLVKLHNDYKNGALIYIDDVKIRLAVSQSVKNSITVTLGRNYTDEQYVNAVINFYLDGKITKQQAIELLESYFRTIYYIVERPGNIIFEPGNLNIIEIKEPIKEHLERFPEITTIK